MSRRHPASVSSLLVAALLAGSLGAAGCARRSAIPEPPRLSREEATPLLPEKVKDRAGWAADIVGALEAHDFRPTLESICAVVAVIEQESGFQEDPAVPGLSKLVRSRLESYAGKLGPLGGPALDHLLSARSPGSTRTFDERLSAVRTERDVDLLFRDLLAYHRGRHPGVFAAANLVAKWVGDEGFAEMNPITTAGSMQVSVRFAEGVAKEKGFPVERVREQLYTREGGVYYGVLRLLEHPLAPEAEMIHRFADYNAGVYSARNAALQAALGELTGRTLALDGDFLSYGEDDEPKDDLTQSWSAVLAFAARYPEAELSQGRIEKDLRKEKSSDFERTDTYEAIRRVYERRKGTPPPYARIPSVVLRSPKLSQDRSTAWFARSVDARYLRCLDRGGGSVTPVRVSGVLSQLR